MATITRYRRSPWPEIALIAVLGLTGLLIPSTIQTASMKHQKPTLYQLATAVAARQGLDPKLVRAVVTVESSWRPGAVSRKDAIGLLQVHHPTWGHKWTRRQLKDPEQNLLAGTTILRKYLKESGTLKEALRKYSGGESGYYEKVKKQMRGA